MSIQITNYLLSAFGTFGNITWNDTVGHPNSYIFYTHRGRHQFPIGTSCSTALGGHPFPVPTVKEILVGVHFIFRIFYKFGLGSSKLGLPLFLTSTRFGGLFWWYRRFGSKPLLISRGLTIDSSVSARVCIGWIGFRIWIGHSLDRIGWIGVVPFPFNWWQLGSIVVLDGAPILRCYSVG